MKLRFTALFLLMGAFGFAQDSNLGNWLIYIGNKKLNSNWNFHHEIQYRNYNAVGDLEQLLLRGGVGYKLPDNSNFLLGYGFIHSENYVANTSDKVDVNEHRVYQQLVSKNKIGRVFLQHRYRLEERWVDNSDFKMRFRYFLSMNIPFNNAEVIEKTWYASAYNEIFINHKQNYFDRNRTYAGIGYKLNSAIKLELGYMNQFLNGGNRDQINLICLASF